MVIDLTRKSWNSEQGHKLALDPQMGPETQSWGAGGEGSLESGVIRAAEAPPLPWKSFNADGFEQKLDFVQFEEKWGQCGSVLIETLNAGRQYHFSAGKKKNKKYSEREKTWLPTSSGLLEANLD